MNGRYTFGLMLASALAGASAAPVKAWLFPEPPLPPIIVEDAVIVKALRAKAFLISAEAPASATITLKAGADKSTNMPAADWWQAILNGWTRVRTKDSVTIRVAGVAEAGFDLRTISADNLVRSTQNEVVLNLGTPTMRPIRIDPVSTKTLRREVGGLNFGVDVHLPFDAQDKAADAIGKAACQKGLLKKAGTSGVETIARITDLLRARGDVRSVRVIFTPGQCAN